MSYQSTNKCKWCDTMLISILVLLGGLSVNLNHLIAWHVGISFRQFGTLPIGIILSNLGSRHLMTSPRTLLGQF